MGMANRVFIALFITLMFSNISYARNIKQKIKYSKPPHCTNNIVTCSNPNEIPTCLVLDPKIHMEIITVSTGKTFNKFQPYCENHPENLIPTCLDINNYKLVSTKNTFVECIEFVKCAKDNKSQKPIAVCSSGRVPKCLGSSSEPNCEADKICKVGIPVCDYIWEASGAQDLKQKS